MAASSSTASGWGAGKAAAGPSCELDGRKAPL